MSEKKKIRILTDKDSKAITTTAHLKVSCNAESVILFYRVRRVKLSMSHVEKAPDKREHSSFTYTMSARARNAPWLRNRLKDHSTGLF